MAIQQTHTDSLTHLPNRIPMSMSELSGKRLVVGLTGGIACYKMAEFIRRAQDAGATIDVVMTEAATRFITPVTLQALSGRPVWTSAWDDRASNNMAHINLTRGADAILVAPATADFMARVATGLADDLLTTLCLARGNCPLLLAPAMNREMWEHPATQRNVRQLAGDGLMLLGPAQGDQACGETGSGRMLEPDELLAEVLAHFQPKVLAGKEVIVTAGPTSEPIDPVRVITNRSSGKMGYMVAQAAHEAGARVTLISGPTALASPHGVTRINVQTASQMHKAVLAILETADVFISVAAVSDWRVANPSDQKLKKTDGQGAPHLQFEPSPDILADVAARPNAPYCVGFAAETERLHENAATKRERKGVPLLVGNLVQEAMDRDDTQLVLFDADGDQPLPRQSKREAAQSLVAAIACRLPSLP